MTTEDRLQITVADYLDRCLPDDAVWFAVPNGGSRNVREAVKLKRMGVKAGVPDLCIIWRRRAILIELKTAKGRVSPEQNHRMEMLTIAGAVVTVCRSLDEVSDFLGQIMPMQGRVAA